MVCCSFLSTQLQINDLFLNYFGNRKEFLQTLKQHLSKKGDWHCSMTLIMVLSNDREKIELRASTVTGWFVVVALQTHKVFVVCLKF